MIVQYFGDYTALLSQGQSLYGSFVHLWHHSNHTLYNLTLNLYQNACLSFGVITIKWGSTPLHIRLMAMESSISCTMSNILNELRSKL